LNTFQGLVNAQKLYMIEDDFENFDAIETEMSRRFVILVKIPNKIVRIDGSGIERVRKSGLIQSITTRPGDMTKDEIDMLMSSGFLHPMEDGKQTSIDGRKYDGRCVWYIESPINKFP
jgi:hypothetical protein